MKKDKAKERLVLEYVAESKEGNPCNYTGDRDSRFKERLGYPWLYLPYRSSEGKKLEPARGIMPMSIRKRESH